MAEGLLKIIKKCFLFQQKVTFVLNILKFCLDFFGYVEKWLDKKAIINFKLYDVTSWETNKYNLHIANISRNKGNQAVKFGQFIEYNMRSIFLEKSYIKCGRETCSRAFSKKNKIDKLSGLTVCIFIQFVFIVRQAGTAKIY